MKCRPYNRSEKTVDSIISLSFNFLQSLSTIYKCNYFAVKNKTGDFSPFVVVVFRQFDIQPLGFNFLSFYTFAGQFVDVLLLLQVKSGKRQSGNAETISSTN